MIWYDLRISLFDPLIDTWDKNDIEQYSYLDNCNYQIVTITKRKAQ